MKKQNSKKNWKLAAIEATLLELNHFPKLSGLTAEESAAAERIFWALNFRLPPQNAPVKEAAEKIKAWFEHATFTCLAIQRMADEETAEYRAAYALQLHFTDMQWYFHKIMNPQ